MQSLQPKLSRTAMMMSNNLCRKGWSSSAHNTETVTSVGHEWSVAVSSIRSDQKQKSFICNAECFISDSKVTRCSDGL